MSAFYDLASLVLVPSGYKASKVYAQKPLTTDGQLTFSRASTATRVNASGALETVSSNVPRLDYTNSTCPKLLLEPQRTQKLTGSNTFTNVYWNLASLGLGSAPVLTANYGTDPFGGNNAWRVQLNLNGGTDPSHRSWFLQSFNPSATVTLSMYIKLNTAGSKTIVLSDSGGQTVVVNSTSWTRISQTVSGGSGEFRFGLIGGTCSDTLDASICYAQCEEGSYATSIINSTSAAVTRLADAASKTGISSLIGQTEGTIFIDVENNETETSCIISTNAGAGANSHIYIGQSGNNLALYVRSGGTYSIIASSIANVIGRKKIALAYGASFARIYMNGTQVYNSTAAVIPSGLDRIEMNVFNTSSDIGNVKFNQALYFTTKLTDTQLAELTTL